MESGLRLTLAELSKIERIDIDNIGQLREAIRNLPPETTLIVPAKVRRDLIHILYDFPGFASGIYATMERVEGRRRLKVWLDGVHFETVDKDS
jgi:hypothetical protein